MPIGFGDQFSQYGSDLASRFMTTSMNSAYSVAANNIPNVPILKPFVLDKLRGLIFKTNVTNTFVIQGNSPPRKTPKDFCFIKIMKNDLLKEDDIIVFQFMPRTISDSKSAMYQDIQIVGRSSPYKAYSSSAPRVISFTMEFFARPTKEDYNTSPQRIKAAMDKLQALTYPIYGTSGMTPPPKCFIQIGNQIAMEGVCLTANVNYNNDIMPWTINEGVYSFGGSVSLSFAETLEIPLSYFDRALGRDTAQSLDIPNGGLVKDVDTIGDSPINEGIPQEFVNSTPTPPPFIPTAQALGI